MQNQILSPFTIGVLLISYFGALVLLARLTSSKATNADFFSGSRKSPWLVVALGMIGTSLSGVTFISVPGWVGASGYSYMVVVWGYLLGYLAITQWLLPIFYASKHTSIYGFLEDRYGYWARKTGALFFLLSRVLGAAFRLYLVALVLDQFVLGPFNIPFAMSVGISLLLIYIYTYRGGIKTIIWTDLFQTAFMLIGLALTILALSQMDAPEIWGEKQYLNNWVSTTDWLQKAHPLKQLLGGALIAFCMTGLDQDMMQKNLSCKNLKESRKNIWTFSIVLVFVNFLFLFMGEGLNDLMQINPDFNVDRSDLIFPTLALSGKLGIAAALFFVLGLIAAAYSSADSALTALTTSVIVDFLDGETKTDEEVRNFRKWTHPAVALLLFGVILIFHQLNDRSVIEQLLTVAGYTYGPLLGLFLFGMIFPSAGIQDRFIPLAIALGLGLAILLKFQIEGEGVAAGNYQFGFEFLGLNGLLCMVVLWAMSRLKPTRS